MLIENRDYIDDLEYINSLDGIEKLDGSTVFITGATGMIGSVLADALMYRNEKHGSGITVLALARNARRAKARFEKYSDDPNFKFIEGDINNPLEFHEKFDYMFHCASNTHPRDYAADPIGTVLTGVVGTKNSLDYANLCGAKRSVFLSSVEIYGENRGDTDKFSESYLGYIDCNTLRAGYPEGKRAGEALCQAYIEKYGMDIVIPRICRVYGPSMLKTDSKALAQFIKKAAAYEDIVLKSEGTQLFSYCYAADVVYGLLFLLLKGEKGQSYNIADERSDIRLKDLAAILAENAGKKVVFELPDEQERKGYSKATKALLDSAKINAMGFKARFDIKSGLERTLKILREEGV